MEYLIQFPAGTQGLVIQALQRQIRDPRIVHRDDSAVVIETPRRLTSAAKLPFAHNVFLVIDAVPRRGDLARSLRQLSARVPSATIPKLEGPDRGFRVMVNLDGQLVSIEREVREAFEYELKHRTQSFVQARGSCREYWVIGRKNLDRLLLCLRLPRSTPKRVEKGALSPELATLLVLASNPTKRDVFLDPFGGSGAIVEARLGYPYASVTYSDIARQTLSPALLRKAKTDRDVRLRTGDALVLPAIGDGEVSVIVSDPPWGEFDRLPMPYPEFAARMAASFDRVLAQEEGRFVLLVTRRQAEVMTTALADQAFRIHATHQILVNGHPATVIVGSR